MVDHLFVYGTLRKGGRTPAQRMLEDHAKLVGQGAVAAAALYDLGPYPGAVKTRDQRSRINGQVFRIDRKELPSVFEELDAYEEFDAADPEHSLYLREVTKVRLHDEVIDAWIYWFNGDLTDAERIPKGEYRVGNRTKGAAHGRAKATKASSR